MATVLREATAHDPANGQFASGGANGHAVTKHADREVVHLNHEGSTHQFHVKKGKNGGATVTHMQPGKKDTVHTTDHMIGNSRSHTLHRQMGATIIRKHTGIGSDSAPHLQAAANAIGKSMSKARGLPHLESASVSTARDSNYTALTEDMFSGKPQIDAENGVIRGVKILGRTSKNGREYTDVAMAEAARLYEGMGVNLSHLGKNDAGADLHGNQPFERGIGWLENIQIKNDGVYGDLHYLKSHPYADALVEAAQRNPNRFGLSHHAYGRATNRNGKTVVESTHSVKSVDIVQNPATTSGLFESVEQEETMPKTTPTTLKKFFKSLDESSKFSPILKLLEMDEYEEAGDMPYDAPEVPAGAAEPAEEDTEDAAIEAIVTLVRALLKGGDPEKAAKVITELNKVLSPAVEEAAEGDAGGDPPDPDAADEEKEAAESFKVKLAHSSELLEAAGIKDTGVKAKALASITDTKERKELIESWKATPAESAKPAPKKPAFSRPLHESAGDESYPKERSSFLRSIGAKPKAKAS